MRIAVFSVCSFLLASFFLQPSAAAEQPATRPLVLAHRGGRKWAPENTLAAFRKSVEAGVDGVELDIHRCKTGELVVIHDETVDRTTNGHGYVKDQNLSELRRLDAGSWFAAGFKGEHIPLLAEVLELVDGKAIVNVEIKNTPVAYPGIDDALIKLLGTYRYPDKIIISSFDHQILRAVHKKAPQYKLAFLDEAIVADLPGYAAVVGATAWNPSVDTVRPDAVATAHQAGIKVNVWTANTEAQWKSLAGMQVDGIFTDDPLGLLRFEGRAK